MLCDKWDRSQQDVSIQPLLQKYTTTIEVYFTEVELTPLLSSLSTEPFSKQIVNIKLYSRPESFEKKRQCEDFSPILAIEIWKLPGAIVTGDNVQLSYTDKLSEPEMTLQV